MEVEKEEGEEEEKEEKEDAPSPMTTCRARSTKAPLAAVALAGTRAV